MKRTFWRQIILLITLLGFAKNADAIPAPLEMKTVCQPDGTTLSLFLKGDEFFHYALSTDGYVLIPDRDGFYTYAVQDSTGTLRAGKIIAVNEDKRTEVTKSFLKTIKPKLPFSESQLNIALKKRFQKASAGQSFLRSANSTGAGHINKYPTVSSPKSLVILVNFSDVSFGAGSTATVFSDMLNKVGYNENSHVGSSRDYFTYNSGGIFTPDFVVAGPVTLSRPMAYYGQNDVDGNDLHPAQMVYDACLLASQSVNFSDFDYDNNGEVDNIYVFYAGKGEADGGGVNTIWPHSWSLSGESLSLTLNGKTVKTYACSSELKSSGIRSGIGTFTHEYGHVLGLPDMYDVDYEQYNGSGFDLEKWSLMAYGSYNGNGCVPPCLSLLERKLLGWANPVELNNAASPTLSELGSTNQGFIINTNNTGEYYLLENRQQTGNRWDTYLPYHGMLIYHIDMRDNVTTSVNYWGNTKNWSYANLWSHNMVNAISNHQCADIEEADNSQINSTESIKGDPFPGLENIKSFTDQTAPSMATWSGLFLNKPITNILEKNGVVSFDFMGGSNFTTSPVSLPAKNIKPFLFTVNWKSVNNAAGYYLDVYTQDISSGDTVKTYVPGYETLFVADTFLIVDVPKDLTTYYYRVRATNNISTTSYSNIISLVTTDGTPVALPATDIKNFGFTANWNSENWAEGYYLDVYTLDTIAGVPIIKYASGYENSFTVSNSVKIDELDDQNTYYYKIRSKTGNIVTRNSNVIGLTTPKASAILPYVKDRTIYLKGMDRGTTVRVFDPMGTLSMMSSSNKIVVKHPGIYLVEATFDGKNQTIKILVQ